VSKRPAIPIEVRRQVLFEARQQCAVCCTPIPLEQAHIDPWSASQDHSAANLIALCANCHSRADKEKWGEKQLKRYKQNPCALAAKAAPVVTAEQKAIIDMVVSSDPDSMTEMQRVRFVSMVARLHLGGRSSAGADGNYLRLFDDFAMLWKCIRN
jgi:type I restriction enzyme R subunit